MMLLEINFLSNLLKQFLHSFRCLKDLYIIWSVWAVSGQGGVTDILQRAEFVYLGEQKDGRILLMFKYTWEVKLL